MSANIAPTLRWRTMMLWILGVTLTAGGVVGMLGSASAQQVAAEPLPTVAFLADAGNFPDALAAGAVAGPMGGPLLLTGPASLDADAARVLDELRPDLVVIAGGPASVGEQVRGDVEALGLTVRRIAGQRRTETAAALAAFAEELGFDRPVVTGRVVTSDLIPGLNAQYLDGRTAEELIAEASASVDESGAGADADGRLADLEAKLDMLADRVQALEAGNAVLAGQVGDLEAENAALTNQVNGLETDNAALQAVLDGVSRGNDDFGRDTLTFTGMNVQIVNGMDETDTSNGVGNLLVGYNALREDDGEPETFAADRAGSHYVIAGDQHHYTAFGGLLAGLKNNATGDWASVTGGRLNTASGQRSSVIGGSGNNAAGAHAAISGGFNNTAGGQWASVSGGLGGNASGQGSSIVGGWGNAATGNEASVVGGAMNTATGGVSTVSGGQSNTASGVLSSVSGGEGNTADGGWSSILGGEEEDAPNDHDYFPRR